MVEGSRLPDSQSDAFPSDAPRLVAVVEFHKAERFYCAPRSILFI